MGYIDPQALDFIRLYGPVAATFVGAIFSFLLTAIMFLGQKTLKGYEDKINMTTTAIFKLTESIDNIKTVSDADIDKIYVKIQEMKTVSDTDIDKIYDKIQEIKIDNKDDHKEMWEYTQQLRAELAMHVRTNELTNKSVNSLEGIVRTQQTDLKELIKETHSMNGKLVAIFRFIDAAPQRATDRTSLT